MANDSDLPYSDPDGRDADFEDREPYGANAAPARFGRLALCTAAAGALAFGVLGTVTYSVWFNRDQQAYAEAIATARQALGIRGPAAASASGRQPAPQAVMAATTQAAAVAATDASARSTAAMPGAPETMTSHGTAPANALTNTASTEELAADQADEEDGERAVWEGRVTQAPAPLATMLADAALTGNTATGNALPGNAIPDTTLADNTRPSPATPLTPAPSPRRNNRRATNADSAAQTSTASRSAKDARNAQQDRNGSAANASPHKSSLFARMGLFFRRVSYRQHDSGRQQQDIYSHP
ncbi:hypothetical protein FVF58_08160 [Paraburkholderia panacisoli]|uniref:Uncharacterized protein n=1 Tax=Paraburkholderia panacisoli TaxID=2603818 RepID=A0A5B0HEM4_9BURK|nr:hypothetical protein [Paraburkholderia panacisoli]KAA1013705.1 hypothetical protein FVF58_08160 [Paraburkholderia panacisoli]